MKKTFKFTEKERFLIFHLIENEQDEGTFTLIDRIEQIVSERITPEQGESIKPYHEHGNSVASDRTELGQSASVKEFLSKTTAVGVIERKGVGEYYMTFDVDKLASILTTYASQVCADKDANIKFWIDGWNHLSRMYDQSQSELDRLNESLTVMLRKNAELEKELEYAKIR